ncbi:MAG: DUF1697 domain-containing protein [Patescibacteria group bacterium]
MKYVALLRGINVGGNAKVEMARLRKVFESLGFNEVRTYINSGNVIFESEEKDVKKLTVQIEKAIEKTFGFAVRTVLREKENILKLAQEIPVEWTNDTEQKTDVLFLWEDFDNKKSLELIQAAKGVDVLLYFPGAIAWKVDRAQYNKSGMRKFIGSVLYKNMTARNVNTVRKLAEMMK